jgi:hypothetical protein
MSGLVDLSKLTPVEGIKGEDAEDTRLLKAIWGNAQKYVESFDWCPPVQQAYLAFGVGGVVAVFLFQFREKIGQTDEWLWVIAGDVPSAYLVLDQAQDPASALEVYCELMEDWARAVLDQSSLDDVFPVRAEPRPENAEGLLRRLAFIRAEVIPESGARWHSARPTGH